MDRQGTCEMGGGAWRKICTSGQHEYSHEAMGTGTRDYITKSGKPGLST